jgi:hypothetical protein
MNANDKMTYHNSSVNGEVKKEVCWTPLSSNLCEPVSKICQYSKEPLNFGLSFFVPVSSEQGSASFFMLQPLITSKVFASMGVLIVAQLIMFLAVRFCKFDTFFVRKGSTVSSERTVSMSLSDLQGFLAAMPGINSQQLTGQVPSGTLETQEAPLVLALTVWGDFQDKPFGPTVFLLAPLFTFPGLRGSLPMLIMELIVTIFVRSVVPPETTGSKPLKSPTSPNANVLQISPENLLELLNRFSKHFR